MKLIINGEERETDKTTITELLKELDIIAGRVAVEVSLKVIKKVEFDTYELHDGDVIEIVYFVGGGQKAAISGQLSAISKKTEALTKAEH